MNENLKYIHIGSLIQIRIEECAVDVNEIAHTLDMSTNELEQLLKRHSIPSNLLLELCKILAYDFFRIYIQHLILYAPQDEKNGRKSLRTKTNFIKNVYTQEVISYLMELTESGRKNYKELSEKYNISITTLTRWADKYGNAYSSIR